MEPLLLHHHLAKNAGTSLRQVLQANFHGGELFENYSLSVWTEPGKWWREWYESLPPAQRARLRCVGAHSAQLLLPVVADRPVQAFCVLRDPVERVTSLYDFSLRQMRRLRESGQEARALGKQARTGRLAAAILNHGWNLKDIYRELGGGDASPELIEFQIFFNGQTREILAPFVNFTELPLSAGLDGLEPYRRRAFQTLRDSYVVGTQDRLSQSVHMFADRFGWRKAFVPRVNVRSPGPEPELDAETRELIRAHNSIDAELHAHYSEQLAGLPPVSRLSQRRWLVQHRARRVPAIVRRRLRAGASVVRAARS